MFTDCGGWWCDEWVCSICCCTYRYHGLADPDEVAFCSSIALQAYFEGRRITPEDMTKCLEYWRTNLSEQHDPINRKRRVCCEDYCEVPFPSGANSYEYCCHPRRRIPYNEDQVTEEVKEVSHETFQDWSCFLELTQ
jgi:hypothetical protein